MGSKAPPKTKTPPFPFQKSKALLHGWFCIRSIKNYRDNIVFRLSDLGKKRGYPSDEISSFYILRNDYLKRSKERTSASSAPILRIAK